MPTCRECDIKMAIHQDDPPWDIFGLEVGLDLVGQHGLGQVAAEDGGVRPVSYTHLKI